MKNEKNTFVIHSHRYVLTYLTLYAAIDSRQINHLLLTFQLYHTLVMERYSLTQEFGVYSFSIQQPFSQAHLMNVVVGSYDAFANTVDPMGLEPMTSTVQM